MAYCAACSKNEFLEAYKSCWMRWRAQGRNDGRAGEEGGWRATGGVSASHLQAWLNNRMLYENKNIICFLKDREGPLICFPWVTVLPPIGGKKKKSILVTKCEINRTLLLFGGYSLINAPGMYQHTDTSDCTKRLFPLKGRPCKLNLWIHCNTNNKGIVAPLWDQTVSHVATFTAGV